MNQGLLVVLFATAIILFSASMLLKTDAAKNVGLNVSLHDIRHGFASWFAGSFVMLGMFILIIISIMLGMYFDGSYSVRWSPKPEADAAFRAYGWVISLGMIFLTAAGVKALMQKAYWVGGIALAAGLFLTVLSATQSVGYVTLKAEEMTAQAEAFDRVETIDTTRLETLQTQRTDAITARDAETTRIEGSIDDIRNDGVAGVNANDLREIGDLNDEITKIRSEYDAEIRRLEGLILLEMESPESAEQVIKPMKFDPGVEVLSFVLTGGTADDAYKRGFTVYYLLIWSLVCPLMGQMLSVFLVMTQHSRKVAGLDKGNRKLNDEQWELWTTYLKRRNAQLKPEDSDEESERERKKSGLPNESNYSHRDMWQDNIRPALNAAVNLQAIRNYYFKDFATVHELKAALHGALKKGWIDQEQYDDLVDEGRRERIIQERRDAKAKHDGAWIRQTEDEAAAKINGRSDPYDNAEEDMKDGP